MQTAVFILSLYWRISRGMKTTMATLLSSFSDDKKPAIEIVVPQPIEAPRNRKYIDYIEFTKEQIRQRKTQEVNLDSLNNSTELFLN